MWSTSSDRELAAERAAERSCQRATRLKLPLEDRIAIWREDDKSGYDEAIELLCDAEDEIRRLKGL